MRKSHRNRMQEQALVTQTKTQGLQQDHPTLLMDRLGEASEHEGPPNKDPTSTTRSFLTMLSPTQHQWQAFQIDHPQETAVGCQ